MAGRGSFELHIYKRGQEGARLALDYSDWSCIGAAVTARWAAEKAPVELSTKRFNGGAGCIVAEDLYTRDFVRETVDSLVVGDRRYMALTDQEVRRGVKALVFLDSACLALDPNVVLGRALEQRGLPKEFTVVANHRFGNAGRLVRMWLSEKLADALKARGKCLKLAMQWVRFKLEEEAERTQRLLADASSPMAAEQVVSIMEGEEPTVEPQSAEPSTGTDSTMRDELEEAADAAANSFDCLRLSEAEEPRQPEITVEAAEKLL